MQRNPTVKAEIQQKNFEASVPLGFFCYPVSQAADITAFHATHVPAGEDQEPMLEQCREIVHKFNSVYGETLTEPEIVPVQQSLPAAARPGRQGQDEQILGNCIYLSDDAATIKKKVMSMYTDPTHIQVSDPGHVEGNTVFTYLDAFSTPDHFAEFLPDYANLDELKAHYRKGGLGDMKIKKFLNNVLQTVLVPSGSAGNTGKPANRRWWTSSRQGLPGPKKKAVTLAEVRHAMRIDYFEDNNLLK